MIFAQAFSKITTEKLFLAAFGDFVTISKDPYRIEEPLDLGLVEELVEVDIG